MVVVKWADVLEQMSKGGKRKPEVKRGKCSWWDCEGG